MYESILAHNLKHALDTNKYIHPRSRHPLVHDSSESPSSTSSGSSSQDMFSKSSDDQGEEQPNEETGCDEDMLYQVVRNGPSYWNRENRRLNAVTKVHGPATLLLTLSDASHNWANFIQNIGLLLRQWPFGPITCHYSRTEFTGRRGLVHVHVALWIDGAPKYDPDMEDVELEAYLSFLDDDVSTEWKQDQMHFCGFNCTMHEDTRGGDPDRVCSKRFPMFPMEKSVILKPFVDGEIQSANSLTNYRRNHVTIKSILKNTKPNILAACTFQQFLDRTVKMTLIDYQNSIRSCLDAPTLFLKRDP
ncbi:unnamed protein product [Allacma fusca]|uniref:Helitron helicase-like domain-containing protein n=1 Tax=Allacma fusca TaxID=39272 RepID=A0A8J2JRT6_9HEXA|nr:unnamed protein product [Allacma fusca]